jgi:transposase-like protein
MTITCPRCESSNVQRKAVVYMSSLSTSKSTTIGVGAAPGTGFFGVGIGITGGSQQTELSRRLAPPVDQPMGLTKDTAAFVGFIFFLFAVLAAVSEHIVFALVLLGIGFFRYMCANSNEQIRRVIEANANRRKKWESEFFCHSCGYGFIPTNSESLVSSSPEKVESISNTPQHQGLGQWQASSGGGAAGDFIRKTF